MIREVMIKMSRATEVKLTPQKYRADIDGLRAVAVLMVVGYHAFPEWIAGGFIGVDIFFVISGFLISTIIFQNLNASSFSFSGFYDRRIKRIFPALMVVFSACLVLGWMVLLPGEYRQLGKHVAGGSGFVSNFVLWHESGYFDNVSDTKPLLHLWSLGIEEQFYIVWPFLLWFAWRLRINWLALIAIIASISFALNIQAVHADTASDFYSPQTRFWELLIGSTLAYAIQYWQNAGARVKDSLNDWLGRLVDAREEIINCSRLCNMVSLVGVLTIAVALMLITKNRGFPGAWALLPTLGAALTIAAGSHAWVNRKILSNPVLVWFGLISFPLYLWHWPLLSFTRIVQGESPSIYVRVAVVLLSMLLAWLTYVGIEKPIRFGTGGRLKTASLLILMCTFFGVGLVVDGGDFVSRSQNISALQYFDFRGYPKPENESIDSKYKFGTLGDDGKNKIVLLGDSHSEQYRNTFSSLIKSENFKGRRLPQIMYSLDYLGPADLLRVSDQILIDNTISVVIISNFWALTYGSEKINYAVRCCGTALGGSVGGDAQHGPLTIEQMNLIDRQLERAASSLVKSGKKVYFVLDNPFGEELAPKGMVSRSFLSGVQIKLTLLPKSKSILRGEPMRSRIVDIAKKSGADIIDPHDYLCGREDCPAMSADGTPMYKDYDHLSLYTAKHLVHYFDFLVPR